MIYRKSVLADLLTPVSAFLRIAADSERAFLLESVEGGEKIGRYSFIGFDPDDRFEGTLGEFRASFPADEELDPSLPPFTGGAVGAFNYGLIHELEKIPGSRPAAAVEMDIYSTVLAFDHLKKQIVIMSREGPGEIDAIEERLMASAPGFAHHTSADRPAISPRSSFSSEQFCAAVERAQGYITAGDIFQVVLSKRFEVSFEGDPFSVYRALRFINPSPYMFFLRRGKQAIAGASPEMLVRVQGRNLEYRPIAGTRRRGRDRDEDEAMARELMADEKERAEHLMLVDLGRNDLGRVSEYGSVSVNKLMFLERYSHVMHLVSSLRGRLRPGLDRFDALAACFPAGTVTGAPKVRAMEIIAELEPGPRGVYAGAVGYLDYAGNLDTCIAIRTIELLEGKAVFQAGAGIVADSVPELEDKECHNKAAALVHALELAQDLSPRHQGAGSNA